MQGSMESSGRLFQYCSTEWLLHRTPSRLDGMNPAKEDSLLWEAASLVAYAAESLPKRATLANSSEYGISMYAL
jgi:hypothetical protein